MWEKEHFYALIYVAIIIVKKSKSGKIYLYDFVLHGQPSVAESY